MSLRRNWYRYFVGNNGSLASGERRRSFWFYPDVFLTPCSFLILIAVVQLGCIIFGQGSFAVGQAGEDGSFYVQIAKNMATGHGITFDGIAPTTGVHWAWQFILAAVFRVVPAHLLQDSDALFRIAGVLYYSMLFAAGCVIYRLTPIGALFMVAYLANRGHWYMETHLVLLTLAMAIRWPSQITGFLLTASRTDMVLFAIFSREWKVAAGAALGFIWACLVNVMVDGSPVGVAAQIKSAGFNDWETIIRTIGALGKYYFSILPIMCFLALFSMDRWFLAALGLLAIHILHNSETEGWYLAPLFLTSLLCSSRVFNRVVPELWDKRRYLGLSGVRG